MPLIPSLPPGRANRKALRFSADIIRLRQAGYTFSAIHRAILDAGLEVGLTTVKREAARGPAATAASAPAAARPDPPSNARLVDLQPSLELRSGEVRTGRDIAQAFFDAHPSNPLFSFKDTP